MKLPPHSPDLTPIKYIYFALKEGLRDLNQEVLGGDQDKEAILMWEALYLCWIQI